MTLSCLWEVQASVQVNGPLVLLQEAEKLGGTLLAAEAPPVAAAAAGTGVGGSGDLATAASAQQQQEVEEAIETSRRTMGESYVGVKHTQAVAALAAAPAYMVRGGGGGRACGLACKLHGLGTMSWGRVSCLLELSIVFVPPATPPTRALVPVPGAGLLAGAGPGRHGGPHHGRRVQVSCLAAWSMHERVGRCESTAMR